jgi:hypothetical protein
MDKKLSKKSLVIQLILMWFFALIVSAVWISGFFIACFTCSDDVGWMFGSRQVFEIVWFGPPISLIIFVVFHSVKLSKRSKVSKIGQETPISP